MPVIDVLTTFQHSAAFCPNIKATMIFVLSPLMLCHYTKLPDQAGAANVSLADLHTLFSGAPSFDYGLISTLIDTTPLDATPIFRRVNSSRSSAAPTTTTT